HVIGSRAQSADDATGDKLGFPVYLIGALIFTLAFLDAGRLSVPRRYAAHLAQWLPTDEAGSIGAILIVLGMLIFAIRIIVGLLKVPANAGTANTAG
ncbi:MAG: cbb3-type cytochrome c oxidase subunit I, partial [Gammaproteobacteria bacterium]